MHARMFKSEMSDLGGRARRPELLEVYQDEATRLKLLIKRAGEGKPGERPGKWRTASRRRRLEVLEKQLIPSLIPEPSARSADPHIVAASETMESAQ
jgi:hypothetical protein